MPYLTSERIEWLLNEGFPTTAGDLNFIVTKLCQEFVGTEPSYEKYNSVVGALESCKLEFYRRAVAPYEDGKAIANGDVYQPKENN